MKVTSWGLQQGLTVLTGQAGQGKSRSLAWLAEEFIQERAKAGRPFEVVFYCPEGPGMFIEGVEAQHAEARMVSSLSDFKARIEGNIHPSLYLLDNIQLCFEPDPNTLASMARKVGGLARDLHEMAGRNRCYVVVTHQTKRAAFNMKATRAPGVLSHFPTCKLGETSP